MRSAARGLGYVPEDCRVFRGMSVRENLEVARRPRARGGPSRGMKSESSNCSRY